MTTWERKRELYTSMFDDKETESKSLEPKSKYSYLDVDNDGTVSDAELQTHHNIMVAKKEELQIEHAEKMLDRQRLICWTSVISTVGLIVAVLSPIIPNDRVSLVSSLLSTFCVAQFGIIGTFMATTAWTRKNGN